MVDKISYLLDFVSVAQSVLGIWLRFVLFLFPVECLYWVWLYRGDTGFVYCLSIKFLRTFVLTYNMTRPIFHQKALECRIHHIFHIPISFLCGRFSFQDYGTLNVLQKFYACKFKQLSIFHFYMNFPEEPSVTLLSIIHFLLITLQS